MAKSKTSEGKKAKPVPEAVRPQNDTVGEMLRVARVAKGISIENASSALNIRAAQLKALEENNLEGLPGMTYAIGFVRGYANFLSLDPVEVVHKFRVEHGHTPAPSKLSFPEPVAESRMPDLMMVGVGSFLAILVLVIWTIYSNAHSGSSKVAEQIPPAPEATTTSGSSADAATAPKQPEIPPSPLAAALSPAPAAEAPAADTTSQKKEDAAASAVAATEQQKTPAVAELAAVKEVPGKTAALVAETPAKETTAKEAVTAKEEPAKEDTAKKTEETATKESAEKSSDAAADEKTADENAPIKVKRGKSRITLQANQASWVQITDAKQNVIYRKVLRPGEQYYVPDQPGLSLVTANAGGLEVFVDNKRVQDIGKPGEIVRGITLDASELKKKKIKVRY